MAIAECPECARLPTPRVLGLDLDRTLLDDHDGIDHATEARLIDLAKRGTVLAIVTGRPLTDSRRFARKISAPYVVALNGAVVGGADGLPLHLSDPIPEVTIRRLRSLAADHRATINVHTATRWYPHLCTPEQVRQYAQRRGMEPSYGLWEPTTVHQVEVVGTPEVTHRIADAAAFLPGVSITTARDAFASYVDVAPDGITKATGLAWILSLRKIPWGEVMAIGDGENDIPVLACAGISVAVPGSNNAAWDAATHRLTESPESPVLTAIRALIDRDATAAKFVSCTHTPNWREIFKE